MLYVKLYFSGTGKKFKICKICSDTHIISVNILSFLPFFLIRTKYILIFSKNQFWVFCLFSHTIILYLVGLVLLLCIYYFSFLVLYFNLTCQSISIFLKWKLRYWFLISNIVLYHQLNSFILPSSSLTEFEFTNPLSGPKLVQVSVTHLQVNRNNRTKIKIQAVLFFYLWSFVVT